MQKEIDKRLREKVLVMRRLSTFERIVLLRENLKAARISRMLALHLGEEIFQPNRIKWELI